MNFQESLTLKDLETNNMGHIKQFLNLEQNFFKMLKILKKDKHFKDYFGEEQIFIHIESLIQNKFGGVLSSHFETLTAFVPNKTFVIQKDINLFYLRLLKSEDFMRFFDPCQI